MSHVCHCLVTSRLDTQVIPVTQENGLIEWVSNTVPIKAVLEDEWTAMLPPGAAMRIKLGPAGNTKALQFRQKYLRMCRPDQRDLALQHHACATQFLPSDVVHMFRQTLKMVPRDLLRRRLLSMSNGADAFMTVRSEVRVFARLVWLRGVQCTHYRGVVVVRWRQFARALAVFNIAAYVLGIGDRHLDNWLLDMVRSDGACVVHAPLTRWW